VILLGGDLGWERGWVRPTNLHYILESPPRLAPKFRLRMRWRLIRVAQTSHNRVSGPWPEDDKVRRQAFCAAAHLRRHAPSGTRSASPGHVDTQSQFPPGECPRARRWQ